jgi:hypothetical protein
MKPLLFLSSLCAFVFLLTACPADGGVNPPPCSGSDCPVLCENAQTVIPKSPGSKFESETTFKDCYARGSSNTATFTIRPTAKADLNAPRAVVVFDIVEAGLNSSPSYILDVFDRNSLKVTPDIFSDTLAMSDVSDGLNATINFNIKSGAPLKTFALVISTFRLQNGQQPDDVTSDPNALVGRASFWFDVE